jgi:hypothetical protein
VIKKPGLSAKALRQGSDRPLRHTPRQAEPERVPRTLTLADVDQGVEAAARDGVVELPTPPQRLPVRLAPTVRNIIEQSGLPPRGVALLQDMLADKLGQPEAVWTKPPWQGRPGCGLYGTALSDEKTGYVYTFVFLVSGEPPTVLVAACEYYRYSRSKSIPVSRSIRR